MRLAFAKMSDLGSRERRTQFMRLSMSFSIFGMLSRERKSLPTTTLVHHWALS